jgi:hypothetical protein
MTIPLTDPVSSEHPDGDGQIETRPLLADIRRRQIDGGPPHGKLEPGIGQRRRNPVARFLDRRIWQPDDDDDGVPLAAIDLHLEHHEKKGESGILALRAKKAKNGGVFAALEPRVVANS